MKNYLKKLALLIAAVGTVGPVWAVDHTTSMGALSTTMNTQAEFYTSPSFTIPYSFSDLLNFTVAAPFSMASASLVSLTTGNVGTLHDSNLSLTLYSGANGTGSVTDHTTSAAGNQISLNDTLAPGTYSIDVSGNADGNIGGGYLFTIAAVPEPGDWMLLLGGIAVGVFIFRRSRDWAGTGGLTIADHAMA